MSRTLAALLASLLFAASAPHATAAGKAPRQPEGIASFPGLRPLALPDVGVTLYYDPAKTQLLRTSTPDAETDGGIRALRSELLGPGKGFFFVDCDQGPSADPSCTVFQDSGGRTKKVMTAGGTDFIFPGTGNVYVEGHTNTMYNQRHKLEWRDGEFRETRQPFGYVGLATETTRQIEIHASKTVSAPVAVLPKGAAITVLLSEGENYLIKTPYGLVGWLKIPQGSVQEQSPVKGIYFAGD